MKIYIDNEPGWIGAFTRTQIPGAIPNGSAIFKGAEEEGDITPLGTPGLVLGSISHPELADGALFYFVEWANRPRIACGVIGWKIQRKEALQ